MILTTLYTDTFFGEFVFEATSKRLASLIERNFQSPPGSAEVGWGDGLLVFRAGNDLDHLTTPFTKINSKAQNFRLEVEFCVTPERCKNSVIHIQDQKYRTLAFLNGDDFAGKNISYPISLAEPNSSFRIVFPGSSNLFLALPRKVRIIPELAK